MPNLARTLLQAFRAHAVREIFGIPGDFALPFLRRSRTARLCRSIRSATSWPSGSRPMRQPASEPRSLSPR
jgi:hypothetical protein